MWTGTLSNRSSASYPFRNPWVSDKTNKQKKTAFAIFERACSVPCTVVVVVVHATLVSYPVDAALYIGVSDIKMNHCLHSMPKSDKLLRPMHCYTTNTRLKCNVITQT